jgi:hypothetical protein
MKVEVLVKDISQKITNAEYRELLAMYEIEREQRERD